jgi:hypothetical protein
MATDGRRVVVLASFERELECSTTTWSSGDGRTDWVKTVGPVPIDWTEPSLLIFAGDSFFIAGRHAPAGSGIYASKDGVTWKQFGTNAPFGDCRLTAFAGTATELVVAPDGGCGSGIWITRAP